MGGPFGRRGRGQAMTLEELLREKREEILRVCAKHGARNVRVFGSAGRGEAGDQSDIDFLYWLLRRRILKEARPL